MDISRVLDFDHLVMSMVQHIPEDESSCGPICQHPACWNSKWHRKKNISHPVRKKMNAEVEERALPTVTYYNMLDDYGESPKDRYPAWYVGHLASEDNLSSQKYSPPLCSDRIPVSYSSPISPPKESRQSFQPCKRVVEVHEVFDKEDLKKGWNETFQSKRYLVWVPNQNRRSLKERQEAAERENTSQSGPKPLPPKDLTETMVPLQIKLQREENILKRQTHSRPSTLAQSAFPKMRHVGLKPDFDLEGIRELVSLPREVLIQVLDRIKASDFLSQEKIHGIIRDVMDIMKIGHHRQSLHINLASTDQLCTRDVLLQQKVPLHYSPKRHICKGKTADQRPVFRQDKGDQSSVVSDAGDTSRTTSPQEAAVKGALRCEKFPQPLADESPILTSQDALPSETEGIKQQKRIPSVSLGLPALPTGLRRTRAFVYNSRHKPDFTLVPLPLSPQSSCSSETSASDQVSPQSPANSSDNNNAEHYKRSRMFLSAGPRIAATRTLPIVAPSLSTIGPVAPAGSPASSQTPFRSPLLHGYKKARDMQSRSWQGLLPSQKISTTSAKSRRSGSDKISSDCFGLFFEPAGDAIQKTSKSSDYSQPQPQLRGTPPQELTSQGSKIPTSSCSKLPISSRSKGPISPHSKGPISPRSKEPISSRSKGLTSFPELVQNLANHSEDWPRVKDPAFSSAAKSIESQFESSIMSRQIVQKENGSFSQKRCSEPSSQGSNRSAAAHKILDDEANIASPAPPPPSPEPKEFIDNHSAYHTRLEHDSGIMEPLFEQSESERSMPIDRKGRSEIVVSLQKPSDCGQSSGPFSHVKTPNPDPNFPYQLPIESEVQLSQVAEHSSSSNEGLQETFKSADLPSKNIGSNQTRQSSASPPSFPVTVSPDKAVPRKLSSPESSGSQGKKSLPSSPRKRKRTKTRQMRKDHGKPVSTVAGNGGRRDKDFSEP